MSIRIMSEVWQSSCQSHTEKLVLLALADNATDEGVCWPSLSTIARKCGLSRVSVILHIANLEKAGWLRIKREFNRSNRYFLKIPGVVKELNHPQLSSFTRVVKPLNGGSKAALPDPSLTISEPSGGRDTPTAAAAKKKPEFWQLSKDRDRLKDQIRQASQVSEPDRELIDGLRSELRKVNQSIKDFHRTT